MTAPCAGCGFALPPDFAFCPKCGRKQSSVCPACGSACPPDFAFCPRCGTPLAPAPVSGTTQSAAPATAGARATGTAPPRPVSAATGTSQTQAATDGAEADRRLVSVLFADLSGFTALSERLDPEDVRAFQNDLFKALAAAVEQFDGFVEKFVGDAVMAVFGAPVAHEDDPERALRAALAMRERMEAINRRWEPCFGAPVALHIGVNTGPVVAGNLGAASGTAYAVTGDTVNTAARLQHAAEPGQILVTQTTYHLTEHLFAFEPLGPMPFKGKAEPVPVYRLLGVRDAPRSARGLEALGLAAPLVGRAGELAQLRAAFERARRGRAQVVTLVGEAGAGKSRLVAEFLSAAAAEGALERVTVRRAACASLGEHTYGVLAAFFREAYGVRADDTLEVAQGKLMESLRALGAGEAETAGVAPLVGYVLGLESGQVLRHLAPEQLQRQIVAAARTLFERRLQQGPLLLVVEDLHWADSASVDLLRHVMERLADREVMLLATHRPAFEGRRLLTSRADHTAIRLAPLTEDDSAALLAGLFGASVERLPARLRELIVARAGGNPFYIEEVVRALVADGVLVRDADGWRCRDDAAGIDIPPTIQGLLLSRLDRLPAVARRVLQIAAVIGSVVDGRLLTAVGGAEALAGESIDVLHDAELLYEAEAGASSERPYRFGHALVQEAVYQNMLVSRRAELHERVGRALETLCGPSPDRLEDVVALGHHWSHSGDKRKGARYLLAAGDWARSIYANDDAIRHYERALGILEECGAPAVETAVVREGLGDLLSPLGRRAAARDQYETAQRAHAASSDRGPEARLLRKLGGLYWDGGDRERALACFERGLVLLEGHPGHIELAHLYQELGRLAFRSGDNQRAIELAEKALERARPLVAGDGEDAREAASVIAHAYNTLGVALARTDRLPEAVTHIEQSIAVALDKGLLQAACRGYTNLGVLYSTLDPRRSIETCLSGLETAKKIGDLGVQSRLYANLAVAYCALTDRCEDEGIAAARTSIELDRQLAQLDHLAVPLIILGQIHQCHGQPDVALAYYREALDLAEQAGDPQLLFPCYDGLATVHIDRGDDAEAEEYMRKAQAVCERAGVDPDSLAVLPFLD
jgi:adenylate cyclase